MGADKTNNIMTLSSGVSQPLLADVQYFELYSSSALNRKLKNIVLPGFYCGFEPVPGTGLSVRITSENSEGKGAASVDVNNVQISVQQIEDVTVSVKAGATNIIVLEANFEHGVKTTQVESASSVSAARIYARTDNTIGQNQIELCRVIVPNGATAVTKEMIVLKYRVNRAVGVEFSNEISSTEERKAATPLAVKTLHDLVDTKAPLDSPHLSGTPTSPTPEPGTNNTQIANAAFVKAAITALINGAPGTLDTLKEIAAAINNDPNFSTTINNALALKAPLASPALTGIPTAPTAAQGTNNTQIATTAYVRAAISALVGSSPEALDTLNELAAALGNDPNFATTMTNALAGKQPLDATLTALAALATGANKLPYFTGKDTVAQTDLTSVGRDILAKTSTLAVIQYLGLRELGTSGEKIPLLSTANTWSARQTFNGGITGALTGNADTATKLKTARTIGGVAFDGSANINLPGVNTTGNQNTTGNAATATKLATARNINGVKFDGSGDVNINTLVSRGRVTALSGSTQGTAGIQMYEAYNNSYPTTYGNVLHMKGASAAGEGELLIGWSGTSGAHAPVFIRSRRDNTDAAWSAWAQVYTSKDSIPGVNTTGNQNTTGNAATATKLQAARTIGGVSFDGSANIDLPGVNKTGNQSTTGNAATATKLLTARTINGVSFDGSANISLSPANIGCPASPTGWLTTGNNGESITTAQLVTLLQNNGAFNTKAWFARCAWAYANSASIPDSETGCGIIPLAGAVIEVFSNNTNNYTIRITTATTTSVSGALTNAEFIYVSNGTSYSPGWRRAYNTKNKPTAADVGALPLSGGALTGGLTAAGEIISKSANGLRIAYGNYGFFIRNDGSNTYFMLTDSGNSLGTYNRLRPLIINNANGAVTIGNGLNVTGGINGSLNGNAATATKLQTARTIGGVSFDGSANINLPGVNIAGNQNTTGNAATATKLQTARTINGVSFDGSKNIELTAEDLNLQETVNKADNAVQKTGDTLSGGLTFENDSILAWIRNTDWAKIGFKNDADSDTDSYMWFETGDNGNEYFKWRSRQSTTTKDLMNLKWDALSVLVKALFSSEVKISTVNALRIFNSSFGAIFRRSEECLHIIPTRENEGENGDIGPLRPFTLNLRTGRISMGHGLDVTGDITTNAWVYANRFAINSSNGMWIQMRDNNAIFGKNIVNTDSAQALLRQDHADRKFMIGGLGNKQFGIYMINNSRTANGTDGQAYMDNNGNWLCGAQVIPGNYGNFDSRYVKDVRLGSQQYYGVNNWQTWNFQCPSGHVLSGINVQDTGSNSADNIAGVYYRPVQKYINGTWYNVASV
ncbi:beta strand repeat-containing protein [Escherichia coli]|uniref:beta strand repeat-containing protein n=5 Tax=Escherichia coli TaxID=562 RepID=UPI0034A541BF